jgi:hypothetical protein
LSYAHGLLLQAFVFSNGVVTIIMDASVVDPPKHKNMREILKKLEKQILAGLLFASFPEVFVCTLLHIKESVNNGLARIQRFR